MKEEEKKDFKAELRGIVETAAKQENEEVKEQLESNIKELKQKMEKRQRIYAKIKKHMNGLLNFPLMSQKEKNTWEGIRKRLMTEFLEVNREIEDLRLKLNIESSIPIFIDKRTEQNYFGGNKKMQRSDSDMQQNIEHNLKGDYDSELKQIQENAKDSSDLKKINLNIDFIKQSIADRQKIFFEIIKHENLLEQFPNLSEEERYDWEQKRDGLMYQFKKISKNIELVKNELGIESDIPVFSEQKEQKEEKIEQAASIIPQPKETDKKVATVTNEKEESKPNEPKPDVKENTAGENEVEGVNNKETIENVNNDGNSDMQNLSFDEKIKNFYLGIDSNIGPLSIEDKLFLANSTIDKIQEKYGSKLFNMTEEEKHIFDEYVKSEARKEGYYLDKESRKIIKEKTLPEFKYGESLTLDSKTDLYNRLFGDTQNGKEESRRYLVLMTLACKNEEIWKEIDSIYDNINKKLNVAVQDIETLNVKTQGNGIQDKESFAQKVAETIINDPGLKNIPENNVEPKGANNLNNDSEKVVHRYKNIYRKVDNGINIKIDGKKIFINDMELDYEPDMEKAQERFDSEMKNDSKFRELFNEETEKDLQNILDSLENGGKDVNLDNNIVFGLIKYIEKDLENTENQIQAIEESNKKINQLLCNYIILSNGNMNPKTSGDNRINITYILNKNGLGPLEYKQIKNMARNSYHYASIIGISNFTKFLWTIKNKAKSILNPKKQYAMLPSKKNAGGDINGANGANSRGHIIEESDKIINEMKANGITFPEGQAPSKEEINRIVDEVLAEDKNDKGEEER